MQEELLFAVKVLALTFVSSRVFGVLFDWMRGYSMTGGVIGNYI